MSITNELRRWAYSTFAHTIFSNLEKKVDEIADRIDAEHRRALEKVAAMVDHDGWVELPVDADGKTIHVGDVVVEDGCGVPYTVMSMKLFEDCWDVGECGMNPNLCRHVQPDSWERIIADAGMANALSSEWDNMKAELVERCKRLAGEE